MPRVSGFSLVELELRRAIAESAGRAGERLERAIAHYTACQAEPPRTDSAESRERLAAARDDVLRAREWLIIQREAMGLRRHEIVDEIYPLPARLGAAYGAR